MIKVGIIGYGYWGPKILRNFNATEGCEVLTIADQNTKAIAKARKSNPKIKIFKDYKKITRAKNIDVVAVVVPVSMHYEITKDALENGKHVFVEKPFTANVHEAKELITLASKKKSKDHGGSYIFIYRRS